MRAHISFLTYVSIPWFHAYPLLFPPRVKCIFWRGEFQSFRCSIPSPLIPKSKLANFSSTSFVRFLSPTILQNIRARISNFRSQTSILSALYHLVREEYRVDRWARFSFFFLFYFPTKNSSPPSLTEISKNLTNSVRSIRKISHFPISGWYLYVLGTDLRYVSTSERFEYTENHTGNWASRGERGGTETNPWKQCLFLPNADGNFRKNFRHVAIYICAWKAKGSRVRDKKKDDFCPRNVKARKKKGRREEAFSFLFKGGQWKLLTTGGWLIRGGRCHWKLSRHCNNLLTLRALCAPRKRKHATPSFNLALVN